jgi:hypothetical protein
MPSGRCSTGKRHYFCGQVTVVASYNLPFVGKNLSTEKFILGNLHSTINTTNKSNLTGIQGIKGIKP